MMKFEPRHVPMIGTRFHRSRGYRRGAGLYGFLGNDDGTRRPIEWWPRRFGQWKLRAGDYRIDSRIASASEVGKPRAAPTWLQRSISPQNSETSSPTPRVKP